MAILTLTVKIIKLFIKPIKNIQKSDIFTLRKLEIIAESKALKYILNVLLASLIPLTFILCMATSISDNNNGLSFNIIMFKTFFLLALLSGFIYTTLKITEN